MRRFLSLAALVLVAPAAAPAATDVPPTDIRFETAHIGAGKVWIQAELIVPNGVARAKACRGKVKAALRVRGELVAIKSFAVSRECLFTGTIGAGSARRARLTVTFPGNKHMGRVSKTRRVKVEPPQFDPNVG